MKQRKKVNAMAEIIDYTTVNIVGYDNWYSDFPWTRYNGKLKKLKITHNNLDDEGITYFIKDGVYEILKDYHSRIKVALLTECRFFDPRRHAFVEENIDKFDYIVTYDDVLIEKFKEKVIVVPNGGSWISHPQIHPKTKLCSYMVSTKSMTEQQRTRVSLLRFFRRNREINISLYGRGHNPLCENHANESDGKLEAYKDYAFSLAMENHRQHNYFSEKLMDCLLTGTIPVYCGCLDIDKYFNVDGMILFDTEDEAKNIINTLKLSMYDTKLDAVRENFELAKRYTDSLSCSYSLLEDMRVFK